MSATGCSFRAASAPPGERGTPDAAGNGSAIVLLVPPPGQPAPTNLASVVVGFAGAGTIAAGDASLVDVSTSLPIVTHARVLATDDPACGQAWCLALDLGDPLAPSRSYEVRIAGMPALALATGDGRDDIAPTATWTQVSSDGCLVVRVSASELVSAQLTLLGRDPLGTRAVSGGPFGVAQELGVSLAGIDPTKALITLHDLAGNDTLLELDELAPLPPAPWAITEVLANPRGPEPAQEWVEVESLASAPQSLAGLWLTDGVGKNLLPDVTVAPGQRVLVVPQGFDPSGPGGDRPPAPGTVLVHVAEDALGQGGLANRGETVSLLDPSGAPISVFTAYYDTSAASWAGRSIERIHPGGCDVRGNQAPNADKAATPGAVNSVEK